LADGCASARLTAFRDPAYPDRRFKNIAVFALGMYLDNAIEVENQLCHKIAPAPCVSGKTVLPPTRVYSNAEIAQYLARDNIDGVLFIVLGDDRSASQYLGTTVSGSSTSITTQSGNVNLYGNTALWNAASQTTTSQQSTATAAYQETRTAHAEIGLFDRVSGNIVWRGEMRVSGQGEANTTDKAFIRAGTNELAAKLKAAGLVP
jgi:hypothetical protein